MLSVGAARAVLVDAGLVIANFEGAEIVEQMQLRALFPSLSAADAFALLLARREDGILLTADKRLRKAATLEGVERHGHLWLVERFSEHGIVATRTLIKLLKAWKANINVRLPDAEVEHTLQRLRQQRKGDL